MGDVLRDRKKQEERERGRKREYERQKTQGEISERRSKLLLVYAPDAEQNGTDERKLKPHVGALGIEPSLRAPKARVLPVYYAPQGSNVITQNIKDINDWNVLYVLYKFSSRACSKRRHRAMRADVSNITPTTSIWNSLSSLFSSMYRAAVLATLRNLLL